MSRQALLLCSNVMDTMLKHAQVHTQKALAMGAIRGPPPAPGWIGAALGRLPSGVRNTGLATMSGRALLSRSARIAAAAARASSMSNTPSACSRLAARSASLCKSHSLAQGYGMYFLLQPIRYEISNASKRPRPFQIALNLIC